MSFSGSDVGKTMYFVHPITREVLVGQLSEMHSVVMPNGGTVQRMEIVLIENWQDRDVFPKDSFPPMYGDTVYLDKPDVLRAMEEERKRVFESGRQFIKLPAEEVECLYTSHY